MGERIPKRLYRCPDCGYVTEYRWVLVRHLYNVEDYSKKDSEEIAVENEYILNPLIYRRRYS
jgi:hypothetical protein